LIRRLVSAATIAGLLAGCTVGPTYHPAEIPVPATFAGAQPSGAAVDPAHWWSTFADPELDRLVALALKDSPDIAIAASRVRQSRLQEIVARANGKPIVNADANVSHVEFSKNAGFASLARLFGGGSGGGSSGSTGIALPGSGITTYAVGFDASWELDLFGGARRGVQAATARTESAEWTRRDAAVTLAAEVAQAYFALRLDQAQLGIVEQELARQRRVLQIAEHVAEVGLVPQADTTQQRGAITSTEARMEPIRADIDLRLHALAILLGQPPATFQAELAVMRPSAPAPAIPAGLPSDLLRRRPDVRAAERDLAAATADIGVAVADLYPKFTLTGMAQLISSALGNLFSGDSLQLTGSAAAMFPILDWGKRHATVKMREEDREQAYQNYRATVLRALRDVEDPLTQIDAERRRHAALARAVVDAEVTAKARESQYRTGFVAQDSLLNAETTVMQAREQLASSDAQLRQMTAALFKALGGGWESAPPVDPATPKAP
jgi:NodT family efflux transporter outer membrane factor (OMF) lipoprotein